MKGRRWKLLLPLALLVVGGENVCHHGGGRDDGPGERRDPRRDHDRLQGRVRVRVRGRHSRRVIAAFSQYAGGKPKSKRKPSAGMTGSKAGGKTVEIVGIRLRRRDCFTRAQGDPAVHGPAGGDVMVGPLSGDEAVAIAN